MPDLTQRIAQMPIEERILLEERLLAARKNGNSQRIPRRGDDGPVPLSFAQERLWFLAQLEPDSTAYNETQVYRFTGELNITALECSLDALADRHDSLRVCFREIDGEVMQVFDTLPPLRLPIVDLQSLAGDAQMAAARAEIDRFTARIFDLTQPPLWRSALIRLEADDYILMRVTHHIISDGWSSAIFWRELGYYYGAFAGGHRPIPLPELPISYADFSVWQREQLQGERLARLVEYWRNRLIGVEPLHLPTDSPRPARPSHKGDLFAFQLRRELSDSISRLARASRVSNYMLMLATFQVLLYRYTGQTDIAVASPIANRTRPEMEGIYGFFVNTLVIRVDCAGNPTFRSLLDQVRENALESYQHQDLPFEKLVEELHPPRNLGRNPFVDILFTLQNMPHSEVNLAGTVAERLQRITTNSKFDLSLYLHEQDGVFEGHLEYATDLFKPATIERMAHHFQTLLVNITADPDSPIDTLPLLSHPEREQLLKEWNRTSVDYPSNKTIHQLFAEQAAQTPDGVAIIDRDRRWTYRDLEEAANRLAHYLIAQGVQPGQAVGILLERSAHSVLAMLASLKAGAAWLPLDPSIPDKRLWRMAEDAGATTIIGAAASSAIHPSVPYTVIQIDTPGAIPDNLPITAPPLLLESDTPAYYLYTSGSTGQPKGIIATHRGAINRMHWMWQNFPFAPGEVVCLRTAIGFVDSVWETFGPILKGCPIAIASHALVREPTALVDFLADQQISRITVVPGLLTHLLDVYEKTTNRIAYPYLWISSGELLPAQLANRFHRLLPQARLLNLYGSSEVAGDVMFWESVAGPKDDWKVPIGRPIDNTEIFLLDLSRQPVPIGVPGELYVGGAGLALGYLNRPDLTAERFVLNPFSNEPGARLYRTGDLARYREDGVIEFLGRMDRQVKIRGFRVEPGEIEAVLREHAAVRDGLVGVLDDETTGKRLVAWWIGKEGHTTDATVLRDFLRQRLPDYMQPAFFVQVESFPLNANGKVDLRRLPAPDLDARSTPSPAPQTPLERQLLAIWQAVLGRKNLGVDDDFFAAGGHSLLAVRLMSKVSQATGQEMPVASLFYAPTIRQQAALIEQKGWSPPWTSLVAVQPGGTRPPLFLVPPAAATAIRFRNFARYLGNEQPLYSFDPLGLDNQTEPLASIDEIAARYVNELRQMMPEGPYLIGGMCFGAHVAFEMARQLHSQNLSVPVLFVFDASQPSSGPTWHLARRTPAYYLARLTEFQQQGVLFHRLQRSLTGRWEQLWLRLRRRVGVEMKKMEPVRIASLEAQQSYTAQAFPIQIVLFQSEEFAKYSLQDGWSVLGTEGLETIRFPNTTHRSLLLEDDNVERIAKKLHEVIDGWIAAYWQDRPL